MPNKYSVRLAAPEDAPVLAEMRRQMFLAMGKPDDDRMRQVVAAFIPWVSDAIRRKTYIGWVVVTPEGDPVANAGMLLVEWPPNTRDLNPVRGYVLNVWTDLEHRRRGLARRLIDTVMREAHDRAIRVLTLHASDEGKLLYEQLGFRTSREMMYVEPQS